MWTYRGPTVDIQARPKQATHVHIFFLLDLFFCRLHSFLYFCFSHAVKAQMFSNYPYAKWVSRKSGAEAEDWSTGSDPASFAISVAPHISSMKALGLRHSRLLTLPQDATNPSQASCCCPFLIPSRFCGKLALTCGSSSVTIERQRNQSREEAIKAYDFIQRKRAARTSWKNAFFGKRTSCLSENS